jgi:hypothetical protein
MRLSSQEIKLLISALDSFLQNKSARLYLYGSRMENHLKGGDIDLLLIAKLSEVRDSLLDIKHVILAEIKSYLGDQKIDLVITTRDEMETSAFLKNIADKKIFLHKWKSKQQ